MKVRIIVWSVILIIIAALTQHTQAQAFKVVGYFPNWADMVKDINNLDYTKLTHINWAFQNPDLAGTLADGDYGLDLLVAKAHAANVKVLVSLGGGAASSGSTMAIYFNQISTEAKRAAFIHKIGEYIDKHKLQGVDVDYEGPAINANYDPFIKQLCDSLRPKGLLITAALNGEATDGLSNATIPLFDWINIMSYDATGSWTPNNPGQHASYAYAETGIRTWSARGAKREQLVVGVPFYGHAFKSLLAMDYDNYNVIIKNFPDAYLKDQEGDVIYYNGIPTIQKKTYLALEKTGGIMIWALSYDTYDSHSLLKAIGDAMKQYNPNDKAPVVTLVSPTADTTIAQTHLAIRALITDIDGVFTSVNATVNGALAAESASDMPEFIIRNLSDGTYTIAVNGVDHQNKTGSASVAVTVSGSPRTPFNGTAAAIPGRIEAEQYDAGALNRTFSDNTAANQGASYRADAVDIEGCSDTNGGYDVGWTAAGEWLEYTVDVARAGSYECEFRVAATSAGRTIRLEAGGVDKTGLVVLPNTGGWQAWSTVKSVPFHLEAGRQLVRLAMNTGEFNINWFDIKLLTPDGVNESGPVPMEFFLDQNYPNPFNPSTTLRYGLPAHSHVTLQVVNVLGEVVAKVVDADQPAGTHTVTWNATVPSGIYFFRITSRSTEAPGAQFTTVRKMIVMK